MPIYKYKKDDKTHYYYAFEVKDYDGSRKTIKKRGFKTKGETELAEASAKLSWNKGVYIDTKKVVFGEYISHWLDNKQDLTEQSRYTNEGHLRNHILPFMGHVQLSNINSTVIEEFVKYLQGKELADGTIRKIFNLVNTSLNAAFKKEMISRNPIDLVDTKPKVRKSQMDCWSKDEVKKFLSSFEHRQKLIFTLAIYTGMRMGEILGLDRDKDIDFEQKTISVRQVLGFKNKIKAGAKTASGNRQISVTDYVMNLIKEHRDMVIKEKEELGDNYKDHGLLICTRSGTPFSTVNCRKMWYRLLKNTSSRQIRFHDLRHTCASLMFQTDPPANPKLVQELLGHSSIKMTLDMYSHMIPNMHQKAVQALEDFLK